MVFAALKRGETVSIGGVNECRRRWIRFRVIRWLLNSINDEIMIPTLISTIT